MAKFRNSPWAFFSFFILLSDVASSISSSIDCASLTKLRDEYIETLVTNKVKKFSKKEPPPENFFLDQQLSWIGKTYDKSCWYCGRQKALITYLESMFNGPTFEPDIFCRKCLTLIKAPPTLPNAIKKDISRYKGEKLPRKKKLEQVFAELNLPYEILPTQVPIKDQRTDDGKTLRKTVWYLKSTAIETLITKPLAPGHASSTPQNI